MSTPDRLTDEEREARGVHCPCGHRLIWHHDQRGCGYHGHGSDRCSCLLTSDDAARLAAQPPATDRDALTEQAGATALRDAAEALRASTATSVSPRSTPSGPRPCAPPRGGGTACGQVLRASPTGSATPVRRAIERMRADVDLRWRATADLLERSAIDLWAHGPLCDCADGCDLCDDALWMPHARAALRLARIYLGETP